MGKFEGKVKALIESLDYDFSHFSQKSFIQYLVNQRQRPLILKPMRLLEVSGGYFCCSDVDYVIYDINRAKILQNHTIIHEIGHILLNHSNEHSKVYGLILTLAGEDSLVNFHLRNITLHPSDEIDTLNDEDFDIEEQEAEYFVRLVITKIIQHKSWNDLTGTSVDAAVLAQLIGNYG